MFQDVPEKRNCAALLAFVSLLWCTEALPLYVTAMAVPLLAVVLRVMVDRSGDGAVRLSAKDAAPAVFKAMFSQARSGPAEPCLSAVHLPSCVWEDKEPRVSVVGVLGVLRCLDLCLGGGTGQRYMTCVSALTLRMT